MDKIILDKNKITELFGISQGYLASISEDELDILSQKININEIDRFILLKPLIIETKSMDDDEKQYWFNILPIMTYEQIRRLLDILVIETKKLIELELKYQQEIQELNKKHLKEWEDFQR
jgi:hypothetical protein